MDKTIFISKNPDEIPALDAFLLDRGDRLFAKSFLQFSPIHIPMKQGCEILFFGSPRAVHYYLEQLPIPNSAQVACAGESTQKHLMDRGVHVDYFVSGSNLKEEAYDFERWCNKRHVCFLTSNISLNTFSTVFPEDQKTIIVVYETTILSLTVPECNIYVFTSPSNVEGFHKLNKLPGGAEIISWGESTSKALRDCGVRAPRQLDEPSVDCLIELLSSIA